MQLLIPVFLESEKDLGVGVCVGDSPKKLLTGFPHILCPFRVCTH